MNELTVPPLNTLSCSKAFSQQFASASWSPSISYYYESFPLGSEPASIFLVILHVFARLAASALTNSISIQYCSIIRSNLNGAHFKNHS